MERAWNMIIPLHWCNVHPEKLSTAQHTVISFKEGEKKEEKTDGLFRVHVKVVHPDDVSEQWLNDLIHYLSTGFWICIKFYEHHFTFYLWVPWDIFDLIQNKCFPRSKMQKELKNSHSIRIIGELNFGAQNLAPKKIGPWLDKKKKPQLSPLVSTLFKKMVLLSGFHLRKCWCCIPRSY